jgi:hypothetical protein
MRIATALLLLAPLAAQPVRLRLDTWEARITPETLTVHAKVPWQEAEIVAATAGASGLAVTGLTRTGSSVEWNIAPLDMRVRISAVKNRLRVRFETDREQDFAWPVTGNDPQLAALIFPDGEGLYIPVADPFWRERFDADPCRTAHGGLSMPFWSYAGGGTLTYLAVTDIRTEVCVSWSEGRLVTRAVHAFRKRDKGAPYEIEISSCGGSPVAPALEYRRWLIDSGRYVTLEEKTRANPETAKLLGAMHAYVFGDGRTAGFLEELRRAGVDRMWVGYDQDPRGQAQLVGPDYITRAKGLGYLIGPYDSFDNIQDPHSADAANSVWDLELYRGGCIVTEAGARKTGFAGRGCELSSEALARAEPARRYIEKRVAGLAATGVNSYFLDCDAFGELLDDYSPAHPMTPEQDRQNRLKRMEYIRGRPLVLGSEGGTGWSAPVIDFAHGMESVWNGLLWQLQKDRRAFGGWWPTERPGIFFKPVRVNAGFATAKYDPAYRLPLFQAAFHGSVVTTDRWDVPHTKLPELTRTRALLELLYNVPSIWCLDRAELTKERQRLAGLFAFFSPLHRRYGGRPLTNFRWLTADRRVQQTVFGERELVLTANFGGEPYREVPPNCIEAQWENNRRVFCPAP